MIARGKGALGLALGLWALTIPRASFAQDFDAVPPAPATTVAVAAAAPRGSAAGIAPPASRVHVRLDGGLSVRSLYDIPFYGGQLRAGIGGHYDGGRGRLFATTQLFYGTDATALRFTYGSLGVLYERAIVGPLYVGGSVDLSFGSVASAQNDYLASGIGLGLHLGYDIVGSADGRALFLQLSPTAAIFTGNKAGGPASLGGALELGYRQ